MQDPERMFAFVNNEDWMVIQTNTFKKVMKELTELKNKLYLYFSKKTIHFSISDFKFVKKYCRIVNKPTDTK